MKTLELWKLVSSGNLDSLNWRERKVVEDRTGLGDGRPKTLREIGKGSAFRASAFARLKTRRQRSCVRDQKGQSDPLPW
jgi:hypothetical protein